MPSIEAQKPVVVSERKQSIVGTALVTLTLITGLICLFMLSCTLTQTRLSTIAFSGVNVSVWKLDDIRKQWTTLRDQIATLSAKAAVADNQKNDANAESAGFDLSYKPARTTLDAKFSAFLLRLKPIDPGLAKTLQDLGPVERVETLESQRAELTTAHPDLAGDVKEITTLGDDYKNIDAKRIRLHSDSDARNAIAKTAATNLEASQAALNDLFSAQFGVKPIDAATRARIENAMFELYSGGPFNDVTHSLVVLSPDILTLCLVVAMGVLGSSLQLTHQLFVRREGERLGVYALRLCVGAITALVIFIVAKAGVPVVADAARLGGDTPINPYFVAFLAIISGLMSEQAIVSVQVQAAKYFGAGTEAETPRYARADLASAVDASKRPRGALAATLGISEVELADWLSGDEPIPVRSQQLLAAILDEPIRDLFSDLPRGKVAPASANSPPPQAPDKQAPEGQDQASTEADDHSGNGQNVFLPRS